MGASHIQSNKKKTDPIKLPVPENRKKMYCKKCGQFFDNKEEHIKTKSAHQDSCFPLPNFFFEKLEKYEFTKFIGSATFTSVFEVKLDNKKFALKWINMNLAFTDEDAKKKLELLEETKKKSEEEIKKFKTLNNDNILKISDYFWATETDFLIIMEFGKTMVTKESADKEKKAEWFFQICQVVQYLHKNEIIHKKLNPHNILLTENHKIVVCDIGGSQKLLAFELEKTFLPADKYLPPEVKKQIAEKDDDIKFTKGTDIWALGIIYHMMLTKNINPMEKNDGKIDPSITNESDLVLLNR